MLKTAVMTMVMVMMALGIAAAQDQASNAGDKAQGAIVIVEPAGAPKGVPAADAAAAGIGQDQANADDEAEELIEVNMSEAGEVTLNLRDADIRNVLKMLAYKNGVNIIAGPEVEATVTIQLKNVPWQKALDVILSTYGYSYEQKGTVLMVTTIDNLKKRREDAKVLADQEPIATETFILNFGKAEEVLKSVEKMKTGRGSIDYDKRTNALIVSDVESNLQYIREVVKQLDAVTPQVLIEARIIETSLTKDESLGIKWPSTIGGTATFAARPHSFPWNPRASGEYLPAVTYATTATTSVDGLSTTVGTPMLYGTLSIDTLSATLNMLSSRTDTNILSNPKIVTMDNSPAEILVGSEYPVPQYTYNKEQNAMQVTGWGTIKIGIQFYVTPHVNNADMVTLDIEPRVTEQEGSVTVEGTPMPILSVKSAKTSVMIKDGETLMIAGLIKEKKRDIVSKVPILGDIPVLSLLFKHKASSPVKTEMVIFLTPHIITQQVTGTPVVDVKLSATAGDQAGEKK